MPLVTVVIPVHNRENLLPETLDSVTAQGFSDWECIIVDDHSTDNSFSVAKAYENGDPRFRAVLLPDSKRYASAARNYGLSLANGEYINFLDSDDLFAPRKLEEQVHAFDQNPELDIVGCRYARFKNDPIQDAYQVKFAPKSYWLEIILGGGEVYLWQTGCPLWRAESVRAIGAWDESNPGGAWQDPDLDIRAIINGLRAIRIEKILLFLRRSDHDRVTARDRAEKDPIARNAILKSWNKIQQAGEVTELRRRQCANQFYRLSWHRCKEGKPLLGISHWVHDSRAIGQGWGRTVYGVALLIAHNYGFLNPVARRLRPRFFKHAEQIPPPLQYVEGFPSHPPLSD